MFDKTLMRRSMAAVTTALILALSVSSMAWSQDVLTLTATGAGSVPIPAGYDWTNVTVQCWGGGGGGGGGYTSGGGYYSYYGGGGGGGAYSAKTYTTPLVAGAYSYYVGAGGGGGGSSGNGVAGGSTFWNYSGVRDIIAGRGGGGSGGNSSVGGLGGAWGTVGAGAGYAGGTGGTGCLYNGGGGGGSGGPSGPGGNGLFGTLNGGGGAGGNGYGPGGTGSSGEVSGNNGSFPGGGGGGGVPGGAGANGEIVITYTPIYSGKVAWSASGGGSWGTLTSNFGANWGGAGYGSPGLDPSFPDSATLGSSVASGTATVTLDGASPSLAALTFSNSTASYTLAAGSGGTLNLNGGTAAATLTDSAGSHTIAAPLALDTSTSVTVTRPHDTLAISGPISGSGGLTTSSEGTLTLTGSNTYTGPTTINQGELIVNGSLASPVTVNSGGMLGGSGSLSSVTVASGGSLSPGAAPNPMNVSGSLALLSGAKMDYALDTPVDSDDVYMPSGPLVLSGQQFADFNFTLMADFAPGTYMLIDAQSITGSLGTSTSGTIDGLPANIAIQGDDVVLNVVPEPSTLALLLAGAIGSLCCASRRKQAAGSEKAPVKAGVANRSNPESCAGQAEGRQDVG